MAHKILVPITQHDVADAIAAAPALAREARTQEATVLVLETDCLHGLLTEVEPEHEALELRRIHEAAGRVASALREHGAEVEVVWECVRAPRRPVDPETVRRHGADAVFLPHPHRWTAFLETANLRRLRREGVTLLQPDSRAGGAVVAERPPGWND